ncbi:MAG: AAA family ATPase, partial [Longimicrobiales bacterium]
MRGPAELVDRDGEWVALRELADLDRPALGLLYGRRRVGKTYLLRHAWPRERVFFFTASETTSAFNRTELIRAVAEWSGEDIRAEDYPTWRTVFRRLLELGGDRALVIVLDEYQYLRGDDGDAVDSELNAAWEGYIYGAGARRALVLILCGSVVGIMSTLNTGARPLYGRFDWQAHLKPFDYMDAGIMTQAGDLRDRVRYYGIYGGTPRYLATIDSRRTLAQNVTRTVLAPDGPVRLQLETAIEQESGLVEPAQHRAIVAAIAAGHTDRNAIAQAVGMAADATFRSRLDTLIELDYIAPTRNFDAAANQPYRYVIADPAVRFYHGLVLPYRNALVHGDAAGTVWRDVVIPRLDSYLGHTFEVIARQASVRVRERSSKALPLVKDWGRW